MKKVLLATTGLVAAAFVASAASAGTPKVTVGGFIDFQAATVSDDNDANQRSHGFRNDSEVSIRVDGKSDSGLGYGAVIDLESDVTADSDGDGLNASRTYIYLDGNFGRFEMGSNEGATETMRIGADSIAAATGGIDGSWSKFANRPATNGSFISTPGLVTETGSLLVNGDETFGNANKINYYSPRFSGFQLGLSYTPDIDDRGQTVTRIDNGASYGDVFDIALAWEGAWDMVSIAAAITGQFGDADTNTFEDIGAWDAGLNLGYAGFSLAGSYGDWDDSTNASGANAESDYWTLGVGYDGGAFALSATYLDSDVETGATSSNEFDNLVIGADYKLAPGLTPYAEVSFYEFDGSTAGATADDNDGTVFLIGTQLAF